MSAGDAAVRPVSRFLKPLSREWYDSIQIRRPRAYCTPIKKGYGRHGLDA